MEKYKVLVSIELEKSDLEIKQFINKAIEEFTNISEEVFVDKYEYRAEANSNLNRMIEFDVLSPVFIESKYLYDLLEKHGKLIFVQVIDYKYIPNQNKEYYWCNEGSTTYHDGGTFVDSRYKFYVKGSWDYSITDMEKAKKNIYCPERYKDEFFKNTKFMWECTACWDNLMNAQTIEEAIKEFEQIYLDKLWKSIKHLKESVITAIDNYESFTTYKRGQKILLK